MPCVALVRSSAGCLSRIWDHIRRFRWETKQALKNVRPPVDLRDDTEDPLEAYYRVPRGAGFVVQLRLDRMRTFGPLGFSCASDGGCPFVKTLLAYQQGHCRSYQDSPLRRFYEIWQPANLAESLLIEPLAAGAGLLNLPPIPWLLPWSGGADWNRWIDRAQSQIARRTRRLGDAYAISRFCGPVSARYGELRLANLVKVYRSIRAGGYRPASHIRANLLVRDGEGRALIADGNHRAAAVAAAGFNSVPVWFAGRDKEGPAVVERGDCRSWPAVRAGVFSPDQALAIFDRVFDANSPIPAWDDSDWASTVPPRAI